MAKVKYYEKRKRSNGSIVHVVNPPKYVREAIGATYQQFEDAEDAIRHAHEVSLAYEDHKRSGSEFQFVDQGSIEGLLRHYYTTHAFTRLAPESKRQYRRLLTKLTNMRLGSSPKTIGEMLTRNFTPRHVDELYQQAVKDFSRQTANQIAKISARAWSVGLGHGMTRTNPWVRIGMTSTPSRSTLWTPEQVKALIDMADAEGEPQIGTWVMLCYHLCQRPGDMRDLLWENYKDGVFRFSQQKTGADIEIAATQELVERLEMHRRGSNQQGAILINPVTLNPYSRSTGNYRFSRLRKKAGLPDDLLLQDLRRTGATELAEAGVTEDELRSVTGHRSRGILNVYVRPTRKMASAAMNKRFKPKED